MSYENKRRYLLLSLGLLLLITAGLLTIQSGTPDPVQAAAPMQEDHFIAFTDTIYEVFEGEDATITVSISPVLPAGQQATVNYRTLGVSAVPGQHYVETQGTLTFTAGANGATQTFVVETIRDGQFGPTRVVNLVLQDAANAQLGTPNIAQLRIINLDPTPVPTPTPTVGGPPIFADQYEPNNTLQTAYTFNAAGSALCQITLWPRGDIDYFRFFAKANTTYDVFTDSLSPGWTRC
jgi:hypothetical protein